MTLEADNVRVAVSGAVGVADYGTTAPTGTSGAFGTDLGYISEDGVTETQPDSGSRNPIKAWQNGATVRVIRSASDDNPTYSFQLMETKLEVIELYYKTTVTQTVSEGSWEIDANALAEPHAFVIDLIDGAELIRTYVPKGFVVSTGDKVYKNDEHVGYEVTVEAEFDSDSGYNAKCWATALASA